jgi:hypothetical protein
MLPISDEDKELDALWRELFGQPLPMLGAPELARSIIAQHLLKSGPLAA